MADAARYALHRPEVRDSLDLGEQRIIALMAHSARVVTAGTVLIEANLDHQYVYRLVSGWAGRIRAMRDGRHQIILLFLPGDLFAIKSMFIARHPDAVHILSAAQIERVHCRDLLRAYREDPDVASRCIWQVIEEERRLHNWVVGLGQGSAEERVAMLLIDLHGRLAVKRTGVATTFQLPLTQVQLADHLGITAVHVNRVLRVFRESGIAVVRDGSVTILDLEKLANLAGLLLDPHDRCLPEHAQRINANTVS
jgi:CRP/FNR family transcriptional regulator, anaerobic regulatory protein